jgi:tetratricopeptide (TPR) repeat protein
MYLAILILATAILLWPRIYAQLLNNYAAIRLSRFANSRTCTECLEDARVFSENIFQFMPAKEIASYLFLNSRIAIFEGRQEAAISTLKAGNNWPPADESLRALLVEVLAEKAQWQPISDLLAGWEVCIPNLSLKLDQLGQVYESKQDIDNAHQAYWVGFVLCPTSSEGILSLTYLGQMAYRHYNPDEAIRYYRMIVSHSPLSAPASAELARLLIERGDLDQALQWAENSIALDPEYLGGYAVRGTVYFFKGDYWSAIADLERVEKNVQSSSVWNLRILVQAYIRVEQLERAKTLLAILVGLDPAFQPAKELLKTIQDSK